MAELDEVGKNGLAYLGVIPRDNGVGVELPGAAGAGQLERIAEWQDKTFRRITADVFDHGFQPGADGVHVLVILVPDVHAFRCGDDRQTGEVALDADALDFLYAAFEIP